MQTVDYWFLAQTKPRQEELAMLNLERQAYVVCLPKVQTHKPKRVGGRHFRTEEILFPGYIFFAPKNEQHSIAPVRSTIGVSKLIRFGVEPARLANRVLEEILNFVTQRQQSPGGLLAHLQNIQPGRGVMVTDGPFTGLSGLVSSVAAQRVTVLLEIMGRMQRLSFDIAQLEGA
jgi:transcriptional antiterminator RfaH